MMMTDLKFLEGVKRLEAAFRCQSLSNESLKIYFSNLQNIEDADFERAVNEIIDSEDFFPSISKIKKYCKGNISYDTAGRELKIL